MKILELLCPSGHFVAGLVFDEEKTSEEKAKQVCLQLKKPTGEFCIICRSKNLHFEIEETDDFRKASMNLLKKAEDNAAVVSGLMSKAAYN